VAATLLSGLALALWTGVQGDDRRTLGLTVAALVGLWTGFVAAPMVAARRKGSGSVVADFGLRVRPVDVPLGLVVGVASQLALVPLLYLPFKWLAPGFYDKVGEEADEVLDVTAAGGRVVLVVLLVLAVPLVEELFFRGLVQGALVKRLGRSAPAVAVGAVVFGVTHYEPVSLLGLVAFGVVLGILVVRAGRLGPALVAHAAFNAVAVTDYLLRQ
jgi:membrane protease YdiL (CAAX protease family)